MSKELVLKQPLVFFDLETTGLDIANDRIVELSYLKLFPDGSSENKTLRLNPLRPMSDEAYEVHHISNEDVQDCPTFKDVAEELYAVFVDADLAGYNSSLFDIPLLAEEFLRAGIKIDILGKNKIDVFTIFQQHEPRNLTAAYRFYCNKDLTEAHSANADILATYEVFKEQLQRYDLPLNVEDLSQTVASERRFADLAGRIAYDKDGKEIFNFGKYKGQRVADVFKRDSSYYGWLQDADFPQLTKNVFLRIFLDLKKNG